MRSQLAFIAELSTSLWSGLVLGHGTTSPDRVNITALASRDGYSVIECWQLPVPGVLSRSATNWVVGGNISQATYSILEPRTTVGEAWAPSVQLTVILNGLIRITTPFTPPPLNDTVAYIMPGTLTSSMVIAADLKETSQLRGHYTEFARDEKTILLQLAYSTNEVQDHVVLYDGKCR